MPPPPAPVPSDAPPPVDGTHPPACSRWCRSGIPLNTRHREVAPNQYECAPYFGLATTQIDENLMVMELMEEIAAKHGLACLLHEKPFKGINGSGKHNNWSIGTHDGVNLLNIGQVRDSAYL